MARTGRPPKPTRLKILAGNPGHRPLNKAEPRPQLGEPKCPSWLSKSAKAKWRRVAPELAKLGLLTIVDGDALAAYCQAWAEFEWATTTLEKEGRTSKTSTGYMQQHPAVSMQRSAFAIIRQFSAMFGLDPSSRSGLTVQPPDDVDDLEELMNRGRKKA